jgi:hypothetical protein
MGRGGLSIRADGDTIAAKSRAWGLGVAGDCTGRPSSYILRRASFARNHINAFGHRFPRVKVNAV